MERGVQAGHVPSVTYSISMERVHALLVSRRPGCPQLNVPTLGCAPGCERPSHSPLAPGMPRPPLPLSCASQAALNSTEDDDEIIARAQTLAAEIANSARDALPKRRLFS